MLSFALVLFSCSTDPAPSPEIAPPAVTLSPIRIGWQTTWATQGQLSVILQKTDILESLGFSPEFTGFSYGGPLNEGALAGEVDVLFTADQPAIVLMNRAASWRVIGRLMYNRVGTFVPIDSPVQSVADLRGRTIAIPFGAAAHRETLGALRAAGLDPSTDVQPVNLNIQELVALIGSGATDGRWGTIDAGSAWDPAYADLEYTEQVRSVADGLVTSVVVMDADYVSATPGADKRFMQAMLEAYAFYRANTALANRWFKEAAQLPFDLAVLDRAASVEPNLSVARADQVSVTLSDDDLAALQRAADFMLEAELLPAPVVVEPLVNRTVTDGLKTPQPGNVTVKAP